jgi:hypothetical protein
MDSFKRVVTNMMARFGTTFTVVIVGDATYNPATSENAPSETTYSVPGVIFDFTLQSNGQQAMPGTQIQVGDKQIFLQPTDTLPALRAERDFVEVAGKRYKVVTYKELNPTAGDNMLIELLVRA